MGKRIVLTGGGTAGHVTPNIALLPALRAEGYEPFYIGSYEGIEKGLIEAEGVPYRGIATGKFRRYLSLKNLTDPFRVIKGYDEARRTLQEWKPDVVFSKGGFVAVPVVYAAYSLKIPVIAHESDLTPGLANRLSFPYVKKICCNFPETLTHLPQGKAVLTGSPIRRELAEGSREAGLAFAGLAGAKPVLLMMGGSSGSVIVNDALRGILPEVLHDFDVIHLCGKGRVESSIRMTGYVQYEYITKELKDLFAAADVVLSRAGANAICELLALHKPNILVPLSKAASRGDQILNARSFEKQGFSYVLEEEEMNPESLLAGIHHVYDHRSEYIAAMEQSPQSDGVAAVMSLIREAAP